MTLSRLPRCGSKTASRERLTLPTAQQAHFCASRALQARLVAAAAKKGQKRDGAEVEEQIYSLDKGWTVEGFEEMAAELNRRLKEQTGKADEGFWTVEGADEEDGLKDAPRGQVAAVYNEDGEWVVEDAFDDETPSDGEPSSEEGWEQSEWLVEEVTEDESNPTLDASTQLSSRDLLKDWAAAKPVNTQGTSIAERAGSGSNAIDALAPHLLRKLDAQQLEADEAEKFFSKAEQTKLKKAKKRQQQLRLIAGSAAGKKLYSPADERTRPMMEKVRGALFSMLVAQLGGSGSLPPNSRWLDVCAGTGAVGLEGLSRGCEEAHFIELDPWIVRKCLAPNIASTGFERRAVVHTMKCEDFLRRARTSPGFAGGAFDFVSVTPPYLLVSYPELFDLLEGSPLLHERSIVMVEYARQNRPDIRDRIGPLSLVKDRKYGRTFLAVYANIA